MNVSFDLQRISEQQSLVEKEQETVEEIKNKMTIIYELMKQTCNPAAGSFLRQLNMLTALDEGIVQRNYFLKKTMADVEETKNEIEHMLDEAYEKVRQI